MKLVDPPLDAIKTLIELVRTGQWQSRAMISALADVIHWLIKAVIGTDDVVPPVFGGYPERDQFVDAVNELYIELVDEPPPVEGPVTNAIILRLLMVIIERLVEKLDDEQLKNWLYELVSWLRGKLA